MPIEVTNPTTGARLCSHEQTTPAETTDAIVAVDEAQVSWKRETFASRAEKTGRLAEILLDRTHEHARLMAEEMGKPISGGRAEIEKCASVCEYYAANAERFLADEPVTTEASESFVAYQPLGVVLAVMPWNFPFWQVFRFAAPALMAGNGALLKHASNVPGCALAIEAMVREAGFPEHLFRSLLIDSDAVEGVIEHPLVRAVTLTGSEAAGRAVAASAGKALKKTVLELGGSDPYVVLADADVEHAAEVCVTSRLINSGQSCIAAKRFVVVDAVRAEFEGRVIAKMKEATMGDPLDENVDIGPQARHDLRDALHDQVERSVARGARCALGGEIPDGPGAFYPATVLCDVKPGMPAYEEELFGPVAAIIEVEDEAAAIRVANDSAFGLGAAVFTRDTGRGRRIAVHELRAGCCFVNDFVRSDPRLPFGGIKNSGYGRELAQQGIREFVNAKTVWVR